MMRVRLILIVIILSGCFSVRANINIVENGVLDLREWNFEENPLITLHGNWDFYWNEYVNPVAFTDDCNIPGGELISVPSSWNAPGLTKKYPSHGYATYHLKIILDEEESACSLNIKPAGTSMAVFVNGKLVAKQGRPGINKQTQIPSYNHHLAFFGHPVKEKDYYVYHVVIHVSNYRHVNGGLWDKVEFGRPRDVVSSFYSKMFWGILIGGLLLMIFIYHLVLFFLTKEEVNFAYALLVLFVFLMSLTNEGRYIYYAFPKLSFEFFMKISYWSSFILPAVLLYYFNKLYPAENNNIALTILLTAYGLMFLFIAFFPADITSKYRFVFAITIGVTILYILFHVMGYALIRRRDSAYLNLFALLIMLLAGVNDILFSLEYIHTYYVAHLGILSFLFLQEYYLLFDAARDKKETKRLSLELSDLNKNLESEVKGRTLELARQNQDLKDQKEKLDIANRELKDLQDYQNKLTHMLVHDLKAPIGTILKLTDYVKVPDEHLLQVVRDSSLRMQMLVLNILDIQKLERAEINVSVENTNLSSLIEKSISQIAFQAGQKHLSVSSDIYPNEHAFADEILLGRVFDNLLDNAVKYSPRGGTIRFLSERIILRSAPGIRIIIEDNGPGIPDYLEDKIFQPYTSQQMNDPEFVSHGLGLAFCKMAIDAMGGSISFISEREVGTKFFIDLPKIRF